MPGPIPKRSDERRRRNKSAAGPVESAPAAAVVVQPEASDEWHSMARDWYVSLGESGQSRFFEPSDWHQARFAAEMMSRLLSAKSRSGEPSVNGQALSAWLSMTTTLLVTEGDRRRLRVELQRATAVDEDEDASVTALDAYRAQLEA